MWSSETIGIKNLPLSTHILLWLALAFILWKICSKYILASRQLVLLKSPPGPWRLPFLGNLLQVAAAHPLPHRAMQNLAEKYGPIMRLKLGQSEAIVISSCKAAEEVLKTHDINFAQRPPTLYAESLTFGQGSIAFAPYGDFWREVRKITVTQLLSSKHVHGFRFIRDQEINKWVASISTSSSSSSSSISSSINFSEESKRLTNSITSQAAFGNECKHQTEFLAALDEAMKNLGRIAIPNLFPSLRFIWSVNGTVGAIKKVMDKISEVVDSIIEDHKRKREINKYETPIAGGVDPRDDHVKEEDEEDIVDVLLKHHESNSYKLGFKLTTGQIKDIVMEIFTAGSLTISTALTWAMSELLKNPRVMKKVQAEVRQSLLSESEDNNDAHHKMDYLKSVVKETLRLHPSIPIVIRESKERCEINGYEFPAKTKTVINLWALARDPDNWGDDADSFKPERFFYESKTGGIDLIGNDFELLPFGSGRRICPGMSFATAVMEQTLFQLLYRFDWELANGVKPDDLDMTERRGSICRKMDDLYVTATPYSSA